MIWQLSFVATFLTLILFDRIIACLSHLILGVVRPDLAKSRGNPLRVYAGMQFAGSLTPLLGTAVSSLVDAALSALAILTSLAAFAFIFSLVFTLLYLIFEYSPDSVVNVVAYWNRFFGPALHTLVFTPLMLLSNVLRPLFAIYNFGVWTAYRIARQILLMGGLEQIVAVRELALACASLVKHLSISLVDFAYGALVDCDFDANFVGDLCFEVGPRQLDLLAPMKDVGEVIRHLGTAVGGVCTFASAPIDIVVYPFTDASIGRGVHGLLNAVAYTLVQLPVVTVKRCNKYRSAGVVMCLPDFEPPLDMLSQGLRDFGQGLDNWIQVTGAVVKKSVGMDVATCDKLSDGLTAANYSPELFKGNQVAVVGLTDRLYAVTDGIAAQYFSTTSRFRSLMVAEAFPIRIDPSHGVASVLYSEFVDERDENGDQRTSMMGCRCVDDDASGEMKIDCAYAMYGEGSTQVPAFKAVFAKRTTALYMTCSRTQISVQSVRWPANRILSADARQLRGACQLKGTCSRVDAIVHVQPLCGAEGAPGLACTPMFLDSACYPYCMAARVQGSGTEDLVLYDADQWHESVVVVDRDCAVERQLETGALVESCVNQNLCGTEVSNLPTDQVITRLPASFLEEWVVNRKWDADLGCTVVADGLSVIPQKSYARPSSLSFASVAGVNQPFSFAGDTTLTAVRSGSGEWSIRVERLYGSEKNEFTMTAVRKYFPAMSPDPDQTFSFEPEDDRVGIPPVYSDMSGIQHPSVSTQSSVFFVVNPSLSMFKGFGAWCITGGMQGRLQLSALSSYAGIRVYKINPFSYCAAGDDGTEACADEEAGWVEVPGGYTGSFAQVFDQANCRTKFSVAVTSMELLDDHNIILTILNATLSEFSLDTGRLKENATDFSHDFLYLNPNTMAISKAPFVEQAVETLTVQGQLCPAMRVYPPLGSLATEAAVLVVEALRVPLALITTLPALIEKWNSNKGCFAATRGHTFLRTCGEGIFLQGGFWESLMRLNQTFWTILGYIAGALRGVSADGVADIVDGVAYFGENTDLGVSMLGGLAGVSKGIQIPGEALGDKVKSVVFPMMPRAFDSLTVASPIKVAKFSSQLIGKTINDVIPIAIQGDDVVRRISLKFLDNLHWSRESYYNGVVRSIQSACNGLSQMLGYTNPWGRLIRKVCETTPLATLGFYDLVLAIVNEVPVAKCMCVDARQSGTFSRYALDTCYPLVPTHMKTLVLILIENAKASGDLDEPCQILVERAATMVESSMQPFFEKAMDAAQEISSGFDYILTKFGAAAGKCLDFDDNVAGAIVLTPEPYDYFSACSLTSFCSTKCAVELEAFKRALLLNNATGASIVEQVSVQAPFFAEANEDSFMPMHIVAMGELTDDMEGLCPTQSRVLAVAGIDYNSTIAVKKFCIPVKKGFSIYQITGEAWWVWYSEHWAATTIDIQFSDLERGDSLVILRDGSGGGEDMRSVTGPDETFVSVHARFAQRDPGIWSRMYWSSQDRMERQMLFQASDQVVGSSTWEVLAINDMLVQPMGMNPSGITVALSIDARVSGLAIVQRSICTTFQMETESHSQALANGLILFRECGSLETLFASVRNGYRPVLYPSGVWLIPTEKELDLIQVPYQGGQLSLVSNFQNIKSNGKFGQRSMGSAFHTWNRMSRGILSGMKSILTSNRKVDGQSITGDFGPRMAQNTLSTQDTLQFFVSGDPAVSTHWLTLGTATLSEEGVNSFGRQSSIQTSVEMTISLQCNRESCLGCPNTVLLNLCYALRQCAVVNCVGTVVSLKRPLCNVGLLIQTQVSEAVQLTQSAWLVFAETYRNLLKVSLSSTDKTFTMEWVDDAFFGYICLAKNSGGEVAALFTSFLGAIVSKIQGSYTVDLASQEKVFVDTKSSARSSMIFAGTTSMLYQMSLLPLYFMIVQQKMATCSVSNLLTKVQQTGLFGGYSIEVGRKDLSSASDVAAGVCLTSFFENEMNERPSNTDKSALATNLLDASSGAEPTTVQKGLSAISSLASSSLTRNLRMMYHATDALITYTSGVVSGIQDMAQSIDENCRVSDYYMYKTMDCACGDKPARIAQASRSDDRSQYWCKGFLQLSDSFGKTSYVNNPYNYDSLAAMVEQRAKEYLKCLAALDGERSSCLWSPVPGIDDGSSLEGKTSIAILQKCRTNYLLKEWDVGAFKAFFNFNGDLTDTERCLVEDGEAGLGAQRCLEEHLFANNITKDRYFAYEEETNLASADACLVATGPAASDNADISAKFAPCVQSLEQCGTQATASTCQLSPMIWEGSTSNRVPVGHNHLVGDSDSTAVAANMIQCAKDSVLNALQTAASYANANLDILIFSADGDALHQVSNRSLSNPYFLPF